jgi:hypothetical protein
VERIKGPYAKGARYRLNETWPGAEGSGFVVGGVVNYGMIDAGQDNTAQVDRCRQNMDRGGPVVPGPNNNDWSGAQFLQYTCAWMGCANTLGPPNSPVCSAGGTEAIAESGIAPPSSFHGAGVNGAFADSSVRFLNNKIDLRVFHAFGTIDGREKYGWDDGEYGGLTTPRR